MLRQEPPERIDDILPQMLGAAMIHPEHEEVRGPRTHAALTKTTANAMQPTVDDLRREHDSLIGYPEVVTLSDCLMTGLAIFCLKIPSMLKYEQLVRLLFLTTRVPYRPKTLSRCST